MDHPTKVFMQGHDSASINVEFDGQKHAQTSHIISMLYSSEGRNQSKSKYEKLERREKKIEEENKEEEEKCINCITKLACAYLRWAIGMNDLPAPSLWDGGSRRPRKDLPPTAAKLSHWPTMTDAPAAGTRAANSR